MINNERVVPIKVIDRLSAIGEILNISQILVTVLESTDVEGTFNLTSPAPGVNYLANQPVKTLNIGSEVPDTTIYFIPAFDYAGFSVDGTAIETAGEEVKADGASLYSATFAHGTVTVTAITPELLA